MKSAAHGATAERPGHAGWLQSIGSCSLRPWLDLPCPGHDASKCFTEAGQRGPAAASGATCPCPSAQELIIF